MQIVRLQWRQMRGHMRSLCLGAVTGEFKN